MVEAAPLTPKVESKLGSKNHPGLPACQMLHFWQGVGMQSRGEVWGADPIIWGRGLSELREADEQA